MNRFMMKQRNKKIISAFLILALITSIFGLNFTTAYAATGLSGFGQMIHSTDGTFYVPTSGPTKNTGGITIKILNCPSNVRVYAQVYKPEPDGTLISYAGGAGFWTLVPGDSDYLNRWTFSNAPAGNYKVNFIVTDGTTPVDILCWIYG